MPPLPQPIVALPVLADDAPGIVLALTEAAKHEQVVFLTPAQCRILADAVGRMVSTACAFSREV